MLESGIPDLGSPSTLRPETPPIGYTEVGGGQQRERKPMDRPTSRLTPGAFLPWLFRLLLAEGGLSNARLSFVERLLERLHIPRGAALELVFQARSGAEVPPIPREEVDRNLPLLVEAAVVDGGIDAEVEKLVYRIAALLQIPALELEESIDAARESRDGAASRLPVSPRTPGRPRLTEILPQGKKLTLLFTDIQDSVRLFERHGDVQARALTRRHEDILCRCLSEAGGHVVERIGDAVFGAFLDASAGVASALAMQQALYAWRERDGLGAEPGVRIGLHVGDVLVERDYLVGSAVNIASRVRDHGNADEVVLSGDVRGLLAAPLAERFAWFGPCLPKGSSSVVELFRWQAPWRPSLLRFRGGSLGLTTFASDADLGEAQWKTDLRGSYRLIGLGPEVAGLSFELNGELTTLGRGQECALRLDPGRVGNRIGRHHAAFLVSRRQLWVFDMGGKGGVVLTYPGDSRTWRVRGRAPVVAGSTLRTGSVLWKVDQ